MHQLVTLRLVAPTLVGVAIAAQVQAEQEVTTLADLVEVLPGSEFVQSTIKRLSAFVA
jgi:hypothetical protein